MTKQWNRYRPDEVATLRRMHAEGASREDMALTLRRGTQSVAHKCDELGLLPHVAPTPWTEERIAELRRLWDAGWSGTEIGRKIGLTKNQCIGKAHRLGLKPRPSPIPSNPGPKLFTGEQKGQNRLADNNRMDCPAEDGPCEPEEEIKHPCQWIAGAPSADDSCKCGAPVLLGRSYCPEHHARAYAGKPPADKAA